MMDYCRFCQKNKIVLLFSANNKKTIKTPAVFACTNCGFGVHGPIVKCLSCGMIYVNENITQSQISTYYEVARDQLYFAEQNARKRTFSNYLKKLEKAFPHKGRLLDIGTNTGLFVKLAQDNGWDAAGLEPNRWAVSYAKKNYKIDLINKPFERNTFPKQTFEVITMWDVIEHFTNPVSEIRKIYHQLKPGGLFAFSTVDPQSLLAQIMGPKWSWYMDMHRAFFTRESAEIYLKKCGFKKIIFKPHWRYLSLGYLASRLAAINPNIAKGSAYLVHWLGAEKVVIPYYANDLFDCYAYK